jgi:penicillin-binding protein 1A
LRARRFAAFLVLLLPGCLTAGLGVGAGYAISRVIRIPKVNDLATYHPDIVTEVRGADGSVVARFAIERRVLIERKQIPDVMVKALLAVEDSRFYEHGGIDVIRIGAAALKDLASHRLAQGASTLTQQLARSVFLTPEKSFARKLNEIFLTVEIEKRFSKDQILTMYLNQVYFGHGNYGVEAASTWFFGHPAKDLTLPEAALLAGMIQRPEDYSPIRNPASAKLRRDIVLRRMAEERFIKDAARREAAAQPVALSRSAQESIVGPYFCEEVRQYLEKQYGYKGLYRQGLKIDTTLEPRIERWAEEALRWGLRRHDRKSGFRKPRNLVAEGVDPDKYKDPSWDELERAGAVPPPDVVTAVVLGTSKAGAEARVGSKRITVPASAMKWTRAESAAKLLKRGDVILLETATSEDGKTETFVSQDPNVEGAVVVIENGSGAVRALVGGYDFSRSKFDRAVQALRQVGSAFKPIVYLTAIESGFTPADTVLDSPISIIIDARQPPYQPQNYYRRYSGIVTYEHALEQSINVAAVRVDLLVGTRKVIETARRLGVRQNLLAYPSLALGAFEVTPLEMTTAYSVFANQGLLYPPRMIERVRDAEGVTLEQNAPEPKEAVPPANAYVLVGMLRGVTQRGTAAAAAKLGLNLGGKTGTTNDYTDAWFIGFTPKHTIGVWVGHESKKTLGPKSTGAEVALPIWMRIVKRMKDAGLVTPEDDYETPAGVVFVPIDLATGYRATPSCGKVVLAAFVNGTQPTELCGDQPHAVSSLPHYLQRAMYAPKRGEATGEEIHLTDAPKLAPGTPMPGQKSTPEDGGPPG